jgi:hypothetical protein
MPAMGIEWAFAFMGRKRKTLNQIVTLKQAFSNLLQKTTPFLTHWQDAKLGDPSTSRRCRDKSEAGH